MDRRLHADYNTGEGRARITGTFFPNGVGVPTGNGTGGAAAGPGWTLARTGVGQYTITLADKWLSLESKQLTPQFAALTARLVTFGAIDLVTARTSVINGTDTAAAAQDIAANANNSISFDLTFKTVSGLP